MAKALLKLGGVGGISTFTIEDDGAGSITLKVNGTNILDGVGGVSGAPTTAIAEAAEAHDLNPTFSDTEVETALNNLGGRINAIISALATLNLIES